MTNLWKILICLTVIFASVSVRMASAQQDPVATSVHCGDILDTEMTPGIPFQDTVLAVPAGTKINLEITPLGSSFNPFIFILDSGGGEMLRQNNSTAGLSEELLDFTISSSNAILRVFGAPPDYKDTVSRYQLTDFMRFIQRDIQDQGSVSRENYLNKVGLYFGAYTISLGCTLRNGTVVEPGDISSSQTSNASSPTNVPSFSGTGFPGLAPVDFANAFIIPLTVNTPISGAIPPAGDAIIGFNIDATANDNLALGFNRLSGNLNLGLVVLSADNKVIFQASLVTTSEFNAKFTLPTTGTYIIGIYRIDLLPPNPPETTAFQITATLNP
ncbi:MAG: hypothetical protein GC179_30080 [Anaerolineaceae bacterium]|nr:hypothetical protein [Anaerolineaceae bacterium]